MVAPEPLGPRPDFVEIPPVPVQPADVTVSQRRVIVALVTSVIVAMTGVVCVVSVIASAEREPAAPELVRFGPVEFTVSFSLPATELLLAALLASLVIAAVSLALESVAVLLTINPRRRLLTSYRPQLVLGSSGPLRITILVPAHNEEASLPVTLAALAEQTRQPDRVVVVADNCTDRTVQIADELGHETFETVGNVHRKGGALNQALQLLLPAIGPDDLVMVMDADTSLSPRFLEVAHRRLTQEPELTAVGGVFYGEPGHGLLGQFQRNEYVRYSLHIRARRGRVFVLTGTASIFRAEALMDVAAARGVFIPGDPGKVYDTSALTEDNELTLALKSLGAALESPSECRVVTELMPTWRNLWVQRQRWQRGALENLAAFGITRATIRYWGQQLAIGYGIVAINLALLMFILTVIAPEARVWFIFWVIIGLIFLLERVISAWSGGWRARMLAALLLPELFYNIFLQVVFLKCLADLMLGRRPTWGHVQHAAQVVR